MKFKVLCMLGVIALSSCNNKNDSDVVSMRFVHKYGFDLSKDEWEQRDKDGQVVTTYKNGVTKNISYKNGILHGPTTVTFPNTSIIQEKSQYNEGALVKRTIYELSGLPVEETMFEADGRKIITVWNTSGVPLSMEEYNGPLLMSARYYTSQNEIEASVIEGNGTRIKRDRSELLLAKEKVENGQIVKRTTFHPNGVIHASCSFVDYKLNGIEETFSPSGALLSRSNWNMGQLDGVQTVYKNKKPLLEITYVNGKKHGVEREYDAFGLITKEINWADDQRHGTSRYTTKDSSDMQWFWRGTPVERKKYQMLKFREELIAQANGEKPIKLKVMNKNEQIALEDEMSIMPEEEEANIINTSVAESQKPLLEQEKNSPKKEEELSLSDIKTEIKALKELQQKTKLEQISSKEPAKSLKTVKNALLKKEAVKKADKQVIAKSAPKSSKPQKETAASSKVETEKAKEIANLEKTASPSNEKQIKNEKIESKNEEKKEVAASKEIKAEKPAEKEIKETSPQKATN